MFQAKITTKRTIVGTIDVSQFQALRKGPFMTTSKIIERVAETLDLPEHDVVTFNTTERKIYLYKLEDIISLEEM